MPIEILMSGEPLAPSRDTSKPADGCKGTAGSTAPVDPTADGSEREARLFEVLTAYLQGVESGHAPCRQVLLDSHPELADDLAAFLDEEDRLHQMIEPLLGGAQEAIFARGKGRFASGDEDAGRAQSQASDALQQGSGHEARDFGDYVLLEVIGAGGMGVVFRARQKGLNREVAVKMIRGGDLAAEDDLRRFRLEAGACAQLDHPHIVPIYEVGEHQGYCYYVMKLIEGGSLEKRLQEFSRDPRAAARLVASVARAVHHAHQRGILHRDLKPSNILIDDEGRGHVADFGLAKRLGARADATQTGLIMGTPSYMAPEQAMGKRDAVTTATDVYGLGALLYSLLTGRPPFRGDSILETIEQVCLREPEPPSGISGRVDRDLQTICLTCLRKEPNRRYASAAALADDLDRWDAGEPIAARPMKHGERAWRWARREPLSAALALALVLVSTMVVVGLVVSNVLISRERDLARTQRRIAEEESRHADVERRHAIERSGQARRAVDEMYTEVAEKWLYDQPRLSQVQRDFLEKALAFYEQFSREEGDDPAAQLERAKAHSRLAWLQLRLGHPHQAEASLFKPTEILQTLIDRNPDRASYLEAFGQACGTLASRFSEQKRWKEANQARERALGAYLKLVKNFPTEAPYRIGLAIQQAQLGLQYQFTGRAAEAQQLGFDGLTSLDRLRREFSRRSDPQDLSSRMRVLEDVGFVLVENRRYDEAEEALRESIAIAVKLPEQVISHQDLLHRMAHTNMYLGYMLGKVGRWSEAEAIYLRARTLFERLAADFPDLPLYQVDVVDAQLGLVDVFQGTSRRPAAMDAVGKQVERSQQLAGAHPELVNCRRTLLAALTRQGRLLAERGTPLALEAVYLHAVDVAEGLASIDSNGVYPRHHLASALLTLGDYLAHSGRSTDALAPFARAIGTLEKLVSDCPAVLTFKQSLGDALWARAELRLEAGQREDAAIALERAADLFRQIFPEAVNDPELADSAVRFFTCCPMPRFRDPAVALELAGRAARAFPQCAMLQSTLGLARYRAGDWKIAIETLTRSRKLGDPGNPTDSLILAMAHHQLGEEAEARACFQHAGGSNAAVTHGQSWRRLYAEASAVLGTR
jgi:eukaryotic-like serine/threonine-protein kinase